MKLPADEVELVKELNRYYKEIKKEIGKVIVGQEQVVDQLLISLLSRGHCLLVGVPGLAKTLLIKTVAEVIALKFGRIQFTPDLMPSDITGTEIIDEDPATGRRQFRFIQGPVFANIILADEINRTPPKTQSALLEAMQEHRVTVAGKTYQLEEPFFVLATQNPIEQEGTYSLPEAQLDRFMFNLWLDYPSLEEEREIVKSTTGRAGEKPKAVIDAESIVTFQNLVRMVPVADNVIDYATKVVHATRKGSENKLIKDYVRWGAGPRASQYLILAAKTKAVLEGRYTPDIDDVKAVLVPVLRHRIIVNFNAEAEGIGSEYIIRQLADMT